MRVLARGPCVLSGGPVAAALVTRAVAERRRAVAGADLAPDARRAALEAWLRREATWLAAARVRHGLDPAGDP